MTSKSWDVPPSAHGVNGDLHASATENGQTSSSMLPSSSVSLDNGPAHSFPVYEGAGERPSPWFQRVLNRFSASQLTLSPRQRRQQQEQQEQQPQPQLQQQYNYPYYQYQYQTPLNKVIPNGSAQTDLNNPVAVNQVDHIPLTRPMLLKFYERAENTDFCEKALTRKEVFDRVILLSAKPAIRDKRSLRHAHPSHMALGSRPTRSDNIPSQSPPPTPHLRPGSHGVHPDEGLTPRKGASTGNATSGGGGRGNTGNRLTLRDMRQIDPKFSSKAAIWVREEAMLVNLENIRAIILYDRMFLFDPDSEAVRASMWQIEKSLAVNLESTFNPFEFRALEGILIYTCLTLESDLSVLEPKLHDLLDVLPSQISNDSLDRVHRLEQALKQYGARARKVQQAIQAVLDDDEDMAEMYLSEKQKRPGIARHVLSHNDVEMLLETYLQQVDHISSKAELLQQAIDDTENLVVMHLDSEQNRVLLLNLIVTAVTTSLSFGALFTGIFGMNVTFPGNITEGESALRYFLAACGILIFVSSSIFIGIIIWCQKKGLFSGKLPGHHIKSAKKRVLKLGGFFHGWGRGQEQEENTNTIPQMTQDQMLDTPLHMPVPVGVSGDTSFGELFDKSGPQNSNGFLKRRFEWLPGFTPQTRSAAQSTQQLQQLQQQQSGADASQRQGMRLGLGLGTRFKKRRERTSVSSRASNALPVAEQVSGDKPHAL